MSQLTVPAQVIDIQAYSKGPTSKIDVAKVAPFGWLPVVLLGSAAFIDRAEGSVTLGAAASLQEEFGFDDAFIGILASAPSIAALLFVIPAGRWADTRNRKNILLVTICLWAFCTLGSGLAVSLAMFTVFRIFLGAATPLANPSSSSLVSDFYPRRSRTKAYGVLRSLETAGLPVGTLVGAAVGGLFGWRVAFFVVFVPAVVLIVLLYLFFREPRRGVGDEISLIMEERLDQVGQVMTPPALGSPEAGLLVSGPQSETVVAGPVTYWEASTPGQSGGDASGKRSKQPGIIKSFKLIFAIRTVRFLIIGQTMTFAAFAGFFAFATLFFVRTYFRPDFIFTATGTVAVPGEGQALAGGLVAGLSVFSIGLFSVISARIDTKLGAKFPTLRVTIAFLAIVVSTVSVALFIVSPALPVRLFFFLVFAGVNIIAVSNLSAAIADVLPARLRGAGFSVFQLLVGLGSSVGALSVGVVSALYGNDLRYGFAALLVPLLVGNLVVLLARSSYVKDANLVLSAVKASASY